MLLFQLVKKDLLLIKRYVVVTMLLLVAIPLFIMRTAPSLPGMLSFLYMVALGELMLLQALSQTEAKSPRAVALLCAAPYSRNTVVQAKYLFFFLTFAYCYVAYTLMTLDANTGALLDVMSVFIVLLCSITIFAIYLPVEFRYGLVKAKFIFMIAVFAFSLGPILISSLFSNISIDFSALEALPYGIKIAALALASVVILWVSMTASLRIFNGKDL
ncbi:MAG: ABC-2 transporter permease [Clostridiales bacterium]|nr:ABC-2 transporter permease [Clostridiales bacterium]